MGLSGVYEHKVLSVGAPLRMRAHSTFSEGLGRSAVETPPAELKH